MAHSPRQTNTRSPDQSFCNCDHATHLPSFRKSPVPVIFLPAILGPEMAAPILWAPIIFWFFLLENPRAHKIPLCRGGRVFLAGGGGGSANSIFMGARAPPTQSFQDKRFSEALPNKPLQGYVLAMQPETFSRRSCRSSSVNCFCDFGARHFAGDLAGILGGHFGAFFVRNSCLKKISGTNFVLQMCHPNETLPGTWPECSVYKRL